MTIEQWDQSNNDVRIRFTIRPMLLMRKIPSHDELTKVKNGNSYSDIDHVDVQGKVPRKVLSFARKNREGSRFDGAIQIAASGAMIKQQDEQRENKSFRSIETVMTNIQDTHVLANGLQIDKLKEDEQASDATCALRVQSTAQRSHGGSRMVRSIRNMRFRKLNLLLVSRRI